MAQFDFGSGMQGAQAGSVAGPYGMAAGFVIGGFVGGHKKAVANRKLKKKQRRYNKAYADLTSPAGYNKTVQGIFPGQRNLIASGPGSQMQSNIDTSLARGGFSGTGFGETARAIGYVAPEVAALNIANEKALPIWQQQIEAFNQKASSEDIGWQGGPTSMTNFQPFGSATGAINMLGTYGASGGSFLGKKRNTGSFASEYGDMNMADLPMNPKSIAKPMDYSSIYNPNYGKSAIGSFGGY